MSEEPAPLVGFSGVVRLFPLPNLVLFPHVIQPLHIFEPRYRKLMADALRDDRLMAMALLRPGWEEEYHGAPPVHPVVCVGRIFKEEHLADGRYNLLLHGLARARVVEELKIDKPYRSARVELLPEEPVTSAETAHELRQEMGRLVTHCFAEQAPARDQLRKLLHGTLPLGSLCDIFSFALGIDVESKQQLLAEPNVARRARLLLETLRGLLPDEAPAARKFPPPNFSAN